MDTSDLARIILAFIIGVGVGVVSTIAQSLHALAAFDTRRLKEAQAHIDRLIEEMESLQRAKKETRP